MPVSQLLNSTSSKELAEWEAYFILKEEYRKEQEQNARVTARAEQLRKEGKV
jgi:hypothetical protein